MNRSVASVSARRTSFLAATLLISGLTQAMGQAPPDVSITSPPAGAQLASGADVVIDATVTDPDSAAHLVEFFVDGARVGEDATGPDYSFTVSGLAEGYYDLSATVTETPGGQTGVSAVVPIQLGDPARRALMLVGDPSNLNESETAIKELLERCFGFEVVVVDDADSSATDALLKEIILNSATVDPDEISGKFRDAEVPVFNWEQASQDDFGFVAGDTGMDQGSTAGNYTSLTIPSGSHPGLAADLSGVVQVFNTPQVLSYGSPPGMDLGYGGIIVGVIDPPETNNAPYRFGSQAVLYAYDLGGFLADGDTVAPARRVHFFLGDNAFRDLTTDGLALFEAAIRWAAPPGFDDPLPVTITVTTISISADNLTLDGAIVGGRRWEGGYYRVLSSANVTSPISAWTQEAAGRYGACKEFTVTFSLPNGPNRFYRIVSP